jgi:hypothetical protein
MHEYRIYYEPADTGDEKVYLGNIQADTMADTLELAAQYYEYPSRDLVAEQITPNTLFK